MLYKNDIVTFDPMSIGDLSNLIMLAVARLGADAWSTPIRELVLQETGRDVTVSTVFVTLTRLEDHGLLRSEKGEAPARGGRAPRIFVVTEAGWAALKEARESAARMWAGLEGTP